MINLILALIWLLLAGFLLLWPEADGEGRRVTMGCVALVLCGFNVMRWWLARGRKPEPATLFRRRSGPPEPSSFELVDEPPVRLPAATSQAIMPAKGPAASGAEPLLDILRRTEPLLPEEARRQYARLFATEHLETLDRRLQQLQMEGVPATPPPPHFAAECTPSLADAWAPFREPMHRWRQGEAAAELCRAFADAITAGGAPALLLLLGQRRTPASVTDARAAPPTRDELLAAAARRHDERDELSVAGRALTKHVPRSSDQFWGDVKGPAAVKNRLAIDALERILANKTWWNIFGHFQHEMVYEARLPSGHGARWSFPRLEFIGFLEPFDEEQCPSLEKPA